MPAVIRAVPDPSLDLAWARVNFVSIISPQPKRSWQQPLPSRSGARDWRLEVFRFGLLFFASIIAVRLVVLQLFDHDVYAALAEGQHALFRQLYPERGRILVRDYKDGIVVPLAMNQTLAFVYAEPRLVQDPKATAETVGKELGFAEEKITDLRKRLDQPKDPYEPIEHRVSAEIGDRLRALALPGIRVLDERARLYPEPSLGGQVLGFLGFSADGTQMGKYGIEGHLDELLAGTTGTLRSEKDISGRLIAVGDSSVEPALNGADVLLTIDRAIQYAACSSLNKAITKHRADSGSVVILDPDTGAILAMCGAPDFDPNDYRSVTDVSTFNNQAIFATYEPGSIFKPVTVAAGIDVGAITPNTSFEDKGEVKVDDRTIKNSDPTPRGWQTMTQALDESLNTGMVFAMRAMGKSTFTEYVKRFGFGEKTGITLDTEQGGDIRPLERKGEIFAATTSFGQGMTSTVLQMAAAFVPIANGGVLKKPYIVDEIRYADGRVEKTTPTDVRRVIETKTSRLVGAMLVSVVENGHGKQAAVPGYYIAGKTGTAQVPKSTGGYDLTKTIGSFAGFGPAEKPRFVMVVRIDNPKDIQWAESTAAPLFGEIASFLVKYLEIPPTRPL